MNGKSPYRTLQSSSVIGDARRMRDKLAALPPGRVVINIGGLGISTRDIKDVLTACILELERA